MVSGWKATGAYKVAHNIDDAAALLAKQMQAFSLTVIEKKSLRKAAEIMGCSHTSVKAYADAYTKALASERVTEDVEARRAKFDAELEDMKALAREIAIEAKRGGKGLTAVGAINSYVAMWTHQRAVQGLDTPKEVKADVDQTMRIVWDDGTEGE